MARTDGSATPLNASEEAHMPLVMCCVCKSDGSLNTPHTDHGTNLRCTKCGTRVMKSTVRSMADHSVTEATS